MNSNQPPLPSNQHSCLSNQHTCPGPEPIGESRDTAPDATGSLGPVALPTAGGVELADFDPLLHAAAVAARPPGALLMAVGWSSPAEDPYALELRHIPDLPAADARRVTELFGEVLDAGDCVGPAWEVLWLWERGTSPAAAAAAEAVTILACRAADADVAAGWVPPTDRARARVRAALDLERLDRDQLGDRDPRDP